MSKEIQISDTVRKKIFEGAQDFHLLGTGVEFML
jgi:hypothetical protein